MSKLKDQIEETKKTIRKNKKHTPWIYKEYHEMRSAKMDLTEAKIRYRKARHAWEKLGR